MLLLDDDDELPASADETEARLASQAGADGLRAIDAALTSHAQHRWLKVARVVSDAMKAGGFSFTDEDQVRLHVRRLVGLVESGALQVAGNPMRPRFSEVQLPESRPLLG